MAPVSMGQPSMEEFLCQKGCRSVGICVVVPANLRDEIVPNTVLQPNMQEILKIRETDEGNK